MSNLKEIIRKKLKEMSATNQGGSSFSAGSGETYTTPFAFSKTSKPPKYYYKLGYKPVPNKIKGSSLQVKQLWEEEKEKTDVEKFQEARLNEFDQIQNELNSLISNAKNQTIEYYTSNPGQFSIYKPTSMALEYIKKAKELLSK
jgi:hypothetical protein